MASLAQRILKAARKPGLDKPELKKMVQAMQERRSNRQVYSALLSFEGDYSIAHDLNLWAGPMLFKSVELQPYPAADPAGILCQSSEYDPFNYLLVSDAEANAAAALRASYAEPKEFGATAEDWLIWAYDSAAGVLCRYQASGNLAALRMAFPDALTRLVAEAAGVDLSAAKRPALILRAADLGRLVEQPADEDSNDG